MKFQIRYRGDLESFSELAGALLSHAKNYFENAPIPEIHREEDEAKYGTPQKYWENAFAKALWNLLMFHVEI